MTSLFKLLCQSCGLSMREATAFLDVRDDTAQSSRTPASAVISELYQLFDKINVAAMEAVIVIQKAADEGGDPDQIELGISSDDHEAQGLGWPCVGAHAAVIRRTIEMLPLELALRVTVVPRGSTPGSAGAADAHGH